MDANHSSGDNALGMSEEERRSGVTLKSAPHRRFFDNKFNQFRWPLFVFSWFIVGLAIVGYFLFGRS